MSLFPVAVVVATYIFKPISDVATIGQSFGTIHAAANRVFAILDAAPRIADSPTASAPAAIESAVAFNGVTFRYGPALPPAVDGVSFTIQPGETVALVGASGAG